MKTVHVGFVGVGWMGEQLLRRLHEHPAAEIEAVCDTNRERTSDILKDVGIDPGILATDYETLIGSPDIDTVFVVSPNTFHGRQALAALKAGKHVFCEKPAATGFDDFVEEARLDAEHPGLATMVDYILYFDDMENRLHELITTGAFGEVTQIQVNYRHPVNIAGDKSWKLRRDIVGDAIGMGPIHAIFTILWHMEPITPISVFATSLEAKVRGFETPPIWNIMIQFANGATGIVQGNIDNGNRYDAYHNVYGTRGGFVFDSQTEQQVKVKWWSEERTGGRWVFPLSQEIADRDGTAEWLWPAGMRMPDSGDVIHHQTRECVDHFLTSVNKQEKSRLSFSKSSRVAEIGFASLMSARTRNPVALPMDQEEASAFFAE